jgi:hypothetical protein
MVFTRRFNICHIQVLLMNLNLVPQAVNVVMGDNLYELKFHVELNPNGSCPQPMDMDNQHEDGGEDARERAGEEGNGNN